MNTRMGGYYDRVMSFFIFFYWRLQECLFVYRMVLGIYLELNILYFSNVSFFLTSKF